MTLPRQGQGRAPAVSLIAQRSYRLRLGLGTVPASVEEVLVEIGDRLDQYGPRLAAAHDGNLVLRLTVAASDLWLALLMAMNAVAGIGYTPEWVEAKSHGTT